MALYICIPGHHSNNKWKIVRIVKTYNSLNCQDLVILLCFKARKPGLNSISLSTGNLKNKDQLPMADEEATRKSVLIRNTALKGQKSTSSAILHLHTKATDVLARLLEPPCWLFSGSCPVEQPVRCTTTDKRRQYRMTAGGCHLQQKGSATNG